jgi:hypothetical protein
MRPVFIIMPHGPGGAFDLLARSLPGAAPGRDQLGRTGPGRPNHEGRAAHRRPLLPAQIQETSRTTFRKPEIAARLAATGSPVEASDGATLSRMITTGLAHWPAVVRRVGGRAT